MCILSLKLTSNLPLFKASFFCSAVFSGDEIVRSTQRCGSILHGPDAHLVKYGGFLWIGKLEDFCVLEQTSRHLDATKIDQEFFSA